MIFIVFNSSHIQARKSRKETWEKSKGNSVLQILNKVRVLRNCAKFPGNTCPTAFFNAPACYSIKKDTAVQMFSFTHV